MNNIVFIDVKLVGEDKQVTDLNIIMDKISPLNDNIQELLSKKSEIKKDLEELDVNVTTVLSKIVTLKMEISSKQGNKTNDHLKILNTMTNTVHQLRLEPTKQNKCRYFNRGYCKFKENCKFFPRPIRLRISRATIHFSDAPYIVWGVSTYQDVCLSLCVVTFSDQ